MIRKPAVVVAVSNTGPLVSAFQCNAQDVLREYFRVLILPPATLTEYAGHNLLEPVEGLIESGFATVQEISKEERRKANELATRLATESRARKEAILHLGEAEAIALMCGGRTEAEVLFIDEPPARALAKEMNLNVIGFPGVLVEIAREGLVSSEEVRKYLKQCQRQGTFYSDELIEEAVRLGMRKGKP